MLEIEDCSTDSHIQVKYVGESMAAMKPFDLDDEQDVARLFETMKDLGVKKYLGSYDDYGVDDLRALSKAKRGTANDGSWLVPFAVVATRTTPRLPEKEVGEYQGFVSFVSNPEFRKEAKRGLLSLGLSITRETEMVEIIAAKWPSAPGGLMVSAVRQACLEINKMKGKSARSENGKYTKQLTPDMMILAPIDPGNVASRMWASLAGFVYCGEAHFTDRNGEEQMASVYRLDWAKLNQIMHKNADAALGA